MIKISEKIVENVVVLSLEGKLSGLENRGKIQDKVRALTSKKKNNIIINLSHIKWIDSTGLGELIASLSTTKKNGGNLLLTNIPNPVQGLLKMTNLEQIFDTYDSVEHALEGLKG
ncbi:MAG: STAS domain-containing protein [bacterium]